MQLKTILNRVERIQVVCLWRSPLGGRREGTIEVPIEPRANGRPICSGCGKRRPGYDRQPARRFEFVPLWQIQVFFIYALRRVDCPQCGVKVERVPWADGKQQLTIRYQWFLADWARRIAWKEVAEIFHTTWQHVHNAVHYAVLWGLLHRDLSGVEAIGVDEIQWRGAIIT